MEGLMTTVPLTITSIMRHAERNHPDVEVISVRADAPRHRCTYGEVFRRARRLANALARLGMRPGDRVATLAWNDNRHLELYYAVSCAGGVLHTINPRLFEDQIAYIVNHAEDRWLFLDPAFVSLVEALAPRLQGVEGFVVLGEAVPRTALAPVTAYEALIAAEADDFVWPELPETTASGLCYTSGTTGNPKGVLYDHRSTVLHTYAAGLPDALGLSLRDCVMPVVPMFHANAWGVPYVGVMAGAKLVLPGPKLGDPATLYALIEEEGVTVALGVPTVWLGLLDWCEREGRTLTRLERTIIGGSACPPAVIRRFREHHGVEVRHAWGMTEMSPLGTVCTLRPQMRDWPPERRAAVQASQGRAIFGVEMRIVDEAGRELARDGAQTGLLQVRGPWVCRGYYRAGSDAHDATGWFTTGDVASIDAEGYLRITDRAKDVIKSGGEWISSIELENVAMAHPDVAAAAVVAREDPRWQERPVLVVVPRDGRRPSREDLLGWFDGKVARWWIPDDVVFVDALPLTATGKVSKLELRRRLAGAAPPGTGG